MKASVKKVVGVSALGALSVVELLHLQQAQATPVSFTGSTVANPHGGSVQVAITVDGASGTYKITGISTPVQPTGGNAAYANLAIPTLTSEALAAQSASITGVSGASQVSAAWISSLSSAIAAAAAGGSPVGQSSVTVAPPPASGGSSGTPAPVSTPAGGGTVPGAFSPSGGVIPTSVAVAPTYYPFYLQPYTGTVPTTGSTNLAPYIAAVSTAINRINAAGGDAPQSYFIAAQTALAQLQAAANQASSSSGSSSSSAALMAWVNNANAGMQYFINQGNTAFTDYYAKVAAAAEKLYADAQASAAAIKAEPAPTVTVTVTATPKPTPTQTGSVINKNVGVIKKAFTCVKTVNGVTTSQLFKAFVIKCPTGFTLLKK
jgi:uncharacterized protein with FMN-binding domain